MTTARFEPPGLVMPVVPIGRQFCDSFLPAAARSEPPVVRTWPVSSKVTT